MLVYALALTDEGIVTRLITLKWFPLGFGVTVVGNAQMLEIQLVIV